MSINRRRYLDNLKVRISQIPPLDMKFKSMAVTEYELLVATIHKLNEVIELVNLTVEEWSLIEKWIESEIQEISTNMLQEMLQNGQLLIDVDYETETETLSFVFKSVTEMGE